MTRSWEALCDFSKAKAPVVPGAFRPQHYLLKTIN
jgi:hypothetical protein